MKSSDGKTGSIRVSTIGEVLQRLDYEDEIVRLRHRPHCTASRIAYRFLKARGYERVRCRYTCGLEKWESAGSSLEANTPDNRMTVFAPTAHTNIRSAGECGGELEALLYQELPSMAEWFWRG
jgi:hypothetical protein